jgi:two-component system cell cycle sensor histidine kinase/response regulator CckA
MIAVHSPVPDNEEHRGEKPMAEPIRILIVEDLPIDAELAEREINTVLKSCLFRRVETRPDYLAALEEFQPDLIVSDYQMPRFDGLTALKLALERTPFTPVIILTGAINEDTAVECMKAGAADYVIKEHIKRLGQAVIHALTEKQVRQERYRAEEALRESEERYRTLVRTLPDAITVTDAAGNITYVSPATLHFYGYEAEDEVLGRNILNWVHVNYHQQALDHIKNVLAGGFITNEEYLLFKKDGSLFFGEVSASCLKDAQDQAIGLIIIVRDISERKQAEEQLLYRASLLQNVSDAIIATDLSFKVTSWNWAAEALYGWQASEVIGQPVNEILQTKYVDDQPEQVLQSFLTQEPWKGEVIHKHRNGTAINILASVSLVKDSTGQPAGIVAVNRDITERKRAEETQAKLEDQLRQAQKMESIGRLAGGVAHDFNNLLTVIQGYCDFMEAQIPAQDPLLKELEQIQRAGERAAALTRQLLAFSRKQIMAPTVLDLNKLVANLRKMLERLIGEDVTLTTVLQPGLWPVTADPGQIEQVIMNLVVNARDAMPTGGTLTIQTGHVNLDDSYLKTHPDTPVGPCVTLAITDTGHGMDEQTQAQIFEPFFTTKEADRGTGLGLATVYGIIKQSGGDITVSSKPGQGTTFEIYLPATETAPNDMGLAASRTQSVTRGGSETILLVEDEESVRNLMRVVLESQGYTVLEACLGSEALSLAGQHPGRIDLLLTDVVMPHMSGRELAERLGTLRPQMKILFISGYTDDKVFRHGLLAAEVEFLPKPFPPNVLISKVREVLDKQAPVDLEHPR